MEALPSNLVDQIADAYKSCSTEERKYLKLILEELSDFGDSPTYRDIWLADYREIPVSIDTFLDDDTFLGKVTRNGKAIYPTWRNTMREVFNAGNRFQEIVLTGATRIGKTSTGITMTAYMLYRLMCLKDPQEFFHKKDVSKFSITFFNITKDLAKGVAFREFNDTLRESPWFCGHGKFSKSVTNFYYIPDGGKIVIDYGSDASHGLGQQIFVGFMDECSFAKAGIKDVNKAKEHMKDLYETISARIEGTFRQNGEVFGKLFAISSKKSDSDFMEYYISNKKQAGASDSMYIVDKPQWDVLPESMFSSEKFYIAVGNKNQKGFVVPKEQETPEGLQALIDQGFTLLRPPIDVKSKFMSDFDIALRDIAGISVPGSLSFITRDVYRKCIKKYLVNMFISNIITVGVMDKVNIEDYCDVKRVWPHMKMKPMYIHLDLSLTGDKSGIGAVWVSGRKDVEDKDGNIVSTIRFTQAFSVSIKAPRGDQIPFNKIVKFIKWLRKSGFNIAGVSRDSYQSEYVGQQLIEAGFNDKKLSLDRTPDGYVALRSVFMEQRIDLFENELMEEEIIHLQRDSFSGAVDHPIGGSKDSADGLAGSVWNAILNNPSVPVEPKKVASAIKAVNGPRPNVNKKPGATLPAMGLNVKKLRR